MLFQQKDLRGNQYRVTVQYSHTIPLNLISYSDRSQIVVVKEDTLTRMSYCQCRLKLVFSSIFKQFGWNHVALLLDRSDLFSLTVGQFMFASHTTKIQVSLGWELRVVVTCKLCGLNNQIKLNNCGAILTYLQEVPTFTFKPFIPLFTYFLFTFFYNSKR